MKREYADLLRKADHIFIEELRRANLYDKVSQAFVVFLPVRWAHLPCEVLDLVSRRIINETVGISRPTFEIHRGLSRRIESRRSIAPDIARHRLVEC